MQPLSFRGKGKIFFFLSVRGDLGPRTHRGGLVAVWEKCRNKLVLIWEQSSPWNPTCPAGLGSTLTWTGLLVLQFAFMSLWNSRRLWGCFCLWHRVAPRSETTASWWAAVRAPAGCCTASPEGRLPKTLPWQNKANLITFSTSGAARCLYAFY